MMCKDVILRRVFLKLLVVFGYSISAIGLISCLYFKLDALAHIQYLIIGVITYVASLDTKNKTYVAERGKA